MQLVNQTAVPARLLVTEMPGEGCRGGMLVAKATFQLAGSSAELVTADPLPIYAAPTPLADVGDLPADLVPREEPAFEISLHGACHAPGGQPAREARVALSVGSVQRALRVVGDRVWVGRGPAATIGEPEPFVRMPLIYERAFGGSAEVRLDPHSIFPVFDPLNQRGKGFDPDEYLAGCAAAFECAPGFPVVAPGPRALPNLEDPAQPVRAWSDRPLPACWATIPLDAGFATRAIAARLARHGTAPTRAQQAQAAYFRAHPDWTFDAPPRARSEVRLEGTRASGRLSFALPALRIAADYELGRRQGVLELRPHALVILAELARFCLVYRAFFRFDEPPGEARSFRLRLAEGWAPDL